MTGVPSGSPEYQGPPISASGFNMRNNGTSAERAGQNMLATDFGPKPDPLTISNEVAVARQQAAAQMLRKMHEQRHGALAKSKGGRPGTPPIAALVAGELRRRILQDAADAMGRVKVAKAQGATATQTAAKAAIKTISGLQQQLSDPALADYDLSDVDALIQQALSGLARLAIDAPPPPKVEKPHSVPVPDTDLTPAGPGEVGTPADGTAGVTKSRTRPRTIPLPASSGLQVRKRPNGRLEYRRTPR